MLSLFDRWFKARLTAVTQSMTKVMDEKELNHTLDEDAQKLIRAIARAIQPSFPPTQSIDSIAAQLQDTSAWTLLRAQQEGYKARYRQIYQQNQVLRSERWNEDWANSWDHFKTLLFRFSSGIMVVFLVLLTGFLSQLWSIPIPMLRIM